MTADEILEKVKKGLNITGNFQDDAISTYIEDVINYMIDAGVKKSVAYSTFAVGAITRGVSDLWNYGQGSTQFSEYFFQRVTQLKLHNDEEGLNYEL